MSVAGNRRTAESGSKDECEQAQATCKDEAKLRARGIEQRRSGCGKLNLPAHQAHRWRSKGRKERTADGVAI